MKPFVPLGFVYKFSEEDINFARASILERGATNQLNCNPHGDMNLTMRLTFKVFSMMYMCKFTH